MAASLEELLAEEGFRGRRSGTRSRTSFRAEAANMPHYLVSEQRRTDSPSVASRHRIKTERSRSDVAGYSLTGELPRSNSNTSSSRRARDHLVRREKLDGGLRIENRIRHGRRSSDVVEEDRILRADSLRDAEEDERVKDIYSDRSYNSERSVKSSGGNGGNERGTQRKGKNVKAEEDYWDNCDKNLPRFRSMKVPETSYEGSVRGSRNIKNSEDNKRSKGESTGQPNTQLALDEVAVQAVVSILNGFPRRFLKDEEFRIAIHKNCFSSSLCFTETEEGCSFESNVKGNFEQAVEIVEKAAGEEGSSSKDLKTAALLLSVITGLNSEDQNDGLPCSGLSSCAHLYLSVIYKLRKKNRVSAKHLLQTFCNSPSLARTILLPELWDHLFFPHLSHLKVWYNQEAESIKNVPSKIPKLQFLDKIYDESLDSGTYQYALYYKDWLTEGDGAPAAPSISVPSMPVQGAYQESPQNHSSTRGSPSATLSSQPMVSKKLYDAMFGRSSNPAVCGIEDSGEANNPDTGASCSDSPAAEVKQTLPHSFEVVKIPDQDLESEYYKNSQDDTFPPDIGQVSPSKEDWKLVTVSIAPEAHLHVETGSSFTWKETSEDNKMLNPSIHNMKAHEEILRSLARSVFELQNAEDSGGATFSALSPPSEPIEAKATDNEEFNGRSEYSNEGSTFASIPQDFFCPLSGQLLGEPVTLETGQTFEREAIREWFNQGNKTCPVTGKTLECLTLPFTNFILRHLIDQWKLENCSLLLDSSPHMITNAGRHETKERDETTIFILENFLSSFSREERVTNARYLVSLGGLEFLCRRFRHGDLEVKTRVASLLCCCIEADTGCRKQIAREIDKQCLFELLRRKESKPSRTAASLLTELVCLSRRTEVAVLFSGLKREQLTSAMHMLLKHLQSSPPEQRPLVAVLLLHLDLMVQPCKNNLYRDEAVDAIGLALEGSLTDMKIRENSCRALLSLGGLFSADGKLSPESWILKQAGYKNGCKLNSEEVNLLSLDDPISLEDEEWFRNLSASLLGSGKRLFLKEISKCLGCGHSDLVTACLTTIAWLSYSLSSLSNGGFQLSAFSALISGLKDRLENGEHMEHKVLASLSLLNFSKMAECRLLLMTIAEDITVTLRGLVDETWTARRLLCIICREDI